jgi:predicted lipid-binding transport protein (Tim44 family)
LINSLGNLGGLFGSYLIGALRNSGNGFRTGLASVGIGLGLAGCLVLLVRARAPDRYREQEPKANLPQEI